MHVLSSCLTQITTFCLFVLPFGHCAWLDYTISALNMSSDICGATFMAGATSSPELFVNVIGTFITEGDIGIGNCTSSSVSICKIEMKSSLIPLVCRNDSWISCFQYSGGGCLLWHWRWNGIWHKQTHDHNPFTIKNWILLILGCTVGLVAIDTGLLGVWIHCGRTHLYHTRRTGGVVWGINSGSAVHCLHSCYVFRQNNPEMGQR